MPWSVDLSKKLELLNYLEPIIKIRRRRISNPIFKIMSGLYDELSLVLLIIDEIIQSIDFSEKIRMGLTRQQLLTRIRPHLVEIDAKSEYSLTYEQHEDYLDNLISYLESNDAKPHKIEFISHDDPNYVKRDFTFRILETELRNDEIYYSISLKIINIIRSLANHHEIEDRISAEKYLLHKQINNGKLDSAYKHAERQIHLAEEYAYAISLIISDVKTSYDAVIWKSKQHVELENIESRLTDWIDDHDETIRLISLQFSHIEFGDGEFFKLDEMKMNILRSHSYFSKLYNMVRQARDIFTREHWNQRMFTSTKRDFMELDPEIIRFIATSKVSQEKQHLEHLVPYFSQLRIPKINSIQKTMNFLSFGTTFRSSSRISVIPPELTFNESISKFNEQVETDAYVILVRVIEEIKPLSLFKLLHHMKLFGASYLIILYTLYFFHHSWFENKTIEREDGEVEYVISSKLGSQKSLDIAKEYWIEGTDLDFVIERKVVQRL